MSRKEQLTFMVDLIEGAGKDTIELVQAINFAKENGVIQNMHMGKSKEWFNEDRENRVSEWIMGQFVDGHEEKNYLGYNSGINISRSFLKGEY